MLTLTGLVKRYGSRTAVDDLSLTVGKGEVFGLLGPNGAGKSTTVHLAVGLVAADAGTVDVGWPRLAAPAGGARAASAWRRRRSRSTSC